jgi:hypothetical protein
MKKLTIGLMLMLALICFTSSSFAASKPSHDPKVAVATESANTILGKLVSVDGAKNEVVVKDQETSIDRTILAEAKDINGLKKDNLVKIVLAPGSTDKAGYIEMVNPDPGKRGKS